MLISLSIRDIVLIEQLDLSFSAGLTVMTGETGAGKSILLDSLGLTLGDRANASLIRHGATQASVQAGFEVSAEHPIYALLNEQDIKIEDRTEPLYLRRVVSSDGRSRSYINNQLVSVGLLRQIASNLVEVQGQHEQMGLTNPATHLPLLDSFGVPVELSDATRERYQQWSHAVKTLKKAQDALQDALQEEEWLRLSVKELQDLAPLEGEEAELAERRQKLQQNERQAEALAEVIQLLSPSDRRAKNPASMLHDAARVLQRLSSPAMHQNAAPDSEDKFQAILEALDQAQEALAEAEYGLARLIEESQVDAQLMDTTEERLFALRAAARKYNVSVTELPALSSDLSLKLEGLERGTTHIQELEQKVAETYAAFEEAADALSAARKKAARALEEAVMAELAPLKLERTRFVVDIHSLLPSSWGAQGKDQVAFLISANPGQPPAPLARTASGGELSRLMLALKVVLAGQSSLPTLIFDEVDSGVGGATASAIGERLRKIARKVQVMVVTHSPQVAARGDAHFRIHKYARKDERMETQAVLLSKDQRREEIARMLSGDTITDAARAAADSLLEQSF